MLCRWSVLCARLLANVRLSRSVNLGSCRHAFAPNRPRGGDQDGVGFRVWDLGGVGVLGVL